VPSTVLDAPPISFNLPAPISIFNITGELVAFSLISSDWVTPVRTLGTFTEKVHDNNNPSTNIKARILIIFIIDLFQ